MKLRRGTALALVGLLFCTGAANAVLAEEDGSGQPEVVASEETAEVYRASSGSHLVQTKVVDLGKVPDETKTEERCDALIVADIETGVLIHEKNINVTMPVGGATVQLMTVVAALDYIDLDETVTVKKQQMELVPRGVKKLNLAEKNEVVVSDLVAAMIYNSAVDAAIVLADIAVERSGAESVGRLMAQKAEQLGMTATNYLNCDGTGLEQVNTTARDQCELYMDALSNEKLLSLMSQGTYQMRSLLTDEGKVNEKNKYLPEKLTNDVAVVVPESRLYDVRLSAAVSCLVDSTKQDDRYHAVMFRAMDYRSDMAILYWTPKATGTVAVKNLINLTDIFSRRKVVDLIPYIEVAANALSVERNGVKISGWFLPEGHVMYGRQMNAYDPDAKEAENAAAQKNDFNLATMNVLLKADMGTLVTNDDGSRTLSAKVLVNNSIEGSVTLATAAKAVQTEVSQNTNTVYTDDDIIPPEPTLMSQYGWMIIIGGVVLLGMLVIIIGVVVRNRMER